MFVVALHNDFPKLVNQVLLNEQFVKVAFFGVDKEAADCFEHIIKYFFEVYACGDTFEYYSEVALDFLLLFMLILYHKLFLSHCNLV